MKKLVAMLMVMMCGTAMAAKTDKPAAFPHEGQACKKTQAGFLALNDQRQMVVCNGKTWGFTDTMYIGNPKATTSQASAPGSKG